MLLSNINKKQIGDGLIDNRTNVINNILENMQPILNEDQISELSDVLYVQLNDYEIQIRTTDLVLADNGPEMALQKFIATKRLEGRSENTIYIYSFVLRKMIRSLNKPLEEITAYDLRYYLASYQEHSGASNRTLENMRCYLRSFFSWLSYEGIIPNDPSAALSPVKYEKKSRKPFSNTEMELLRQACTNKRDRALIEFLYASGCRISEVITLDRDDVDFAQKCTTVMGKGGKQRTVYLSDSALLYLSEYLNSRTDGYPSLFQSFKPSNNDHRMTLSGAEYVIKQIGKRAGVKDVHPHRFRRTLATNMISRGAAIQDVSSILGHESISTTQIYCTISQEDVQHTYHRCIA